MVHEVVLPGSRYKTPANFGGLYLLFSGGVTFFTIIDSVHRRGFYLKAK